MKIKQETTIHESHAASNEVSVTNVIHELKQKVLHEASRLISKKVEKDKDGNINIQVELFAMTPEHLIDVIGSLMNIKNLGKGEVKKEAETLIDKLIDWY